MIRLAWQMRDKFYTILGPTAQITEILYNEPDSIHRNVSFRLIAKQKSLRNEISSLALITRSFKMSSPSSTDDNHRSENQMRKIMIRLFSYAASISLVRVFFQVFTSSSVKARGRGEGVGYSPI